ncbi:MAG TPA: nucleoside 2-deoxyribosyltransferase [Solirubrobacteraceae bacterium]|nr:nucleoside 2-deoxyribosyltransferase [Solirubrobacteraceae bacterium]
MTDRLHPMPASKPSSTLPRCYVASPLGFTASGRHYYTNVLLPALSRVVHPVDPWALTSGGEWARVAREGRTHELARLAGRRNSDAIRSCALLVAILDGQEVDAGTAAEVGFGAALGLTCLGLRTDLRTTGEAGTTVSLQVESFIEQSGGHVFDQLDDLLADLGARHRPTGAPGCGPV